VCPLKIYTLACSVGGHQNLDFRIVQKGFLGFSSFLSAHSSVDVNDRSGPTKKRGNAFDKVVKSVSVFCEDNKLLRRKNRGFQGFQTVGSSGLPDAFRGSPRNKKLREEVG